MLAVRFVVVVRARFALAGTIVFALLRTLVFARGGTLVFARTYRMPPVGRFGCALASPRCDLSTLGRTLTFLKASDNVVVDGNQETRTETKGGGKCP